MSIIQDLYNIYDKEYARYRTRKSSHHRLLIEMRHNLAFLREGLREDLAQEAIVAGLEDGQFNAANRAGVNLARLQKRPLAATTYAGIREFERYRGWTTGRLIDGVYERIATLKKLAAGNKAIDLRPRLRVLFKYLMLVVAHIEGRQLRIAQRG